MIRFKTFGLAAVLAFGAVTPPVSAQEQFVPQTPTRQSWSFAGPLGHYDTAQLQRGFQVFREVCSNCHSAQDLHFRNLSQPGGPEFSEAQVRALAAEYKVQDGPDDSGAMFERPARPADAWPWVYANENAAKATLGVSPPDMSVLAKARSYSRGFPLFFFDLFTQYQEQGPDYIYSLLAEGYTDPKDLNHNVVFQNGPHIAMPKPLTDGQVEYTDGSPKTVQQYAKDVAAFLMWVAEPTLEQRKKTGLRVMVFLVIFAGLLYFTKKKIWADAH